MQNLSDRLAGDFPGLTFSRGATFAWSPETRTVTYIEHEDPALLLHELGHATLEHTQYSQDIELIRMEAAAWDKAQQLAAIYDTAINEELVEETLNSYREWLHARSLCPLCGSNGFQSSPATYTCPSCHTDWTVNEARTCGLKRTVIKNNP